MDKSELEEKVQQLINLSIQLKDLKTNIAKLKGELLEYSDLENSFQECWQADNGYVEINTVTKYKLAEIPADVKVPSDIASNDVAEEAFKAKITLTKEGKKMFNEQNPSIVKLMIPTTRKVLKITI